MTDGFEHDPPEPGPPSDPLDAALAARRWWLNLQIALALSGGAFWFVGAYFEQDFLSGVGAGFVASALLMRIGRRAAADD